MSTHHLGRLWTVVNKVVQISFQVDTDDQAVTTAGRPHHTNLLVGNADDALLAHPPCLDVLTRFGIPGPDSLVSTSRNKLLRVLRPGNTEDASGVYSLANLTLGFTGLAIV